ncbi:transposase [Amycolatopsis sp. cmx-11-12]|uniref:transposase n=1 Tax=Amycolatopsis sp. cmx-11-12 TaxID=2785795 RepID=UPI003918219D
MPNAYPAEFQARAVALVRAGRSVWETAHELEISKSCLHNWVKQDLVDHGERPGRAAPSTPISWRRSDGSASWRPSWRSCTRPRGSTRS